MPSRRTADRRNPQSDDESGLEPAFPEEDVNPIVFNGIRTHTKQHDFFSKKGNGYVKAIHVEPLTDAEFRFDF